jgi:hypothetical protein
MSSVVEISPGDVVSLGSTESIVDVVKGHGGSTLGAVWGLAGVTCLGASLEGTSEHGFPGIGDSK